MTETGHMGNPELAENAERRRSSTGDSMQDLCAFLEGLRQKAGLSSLALADQDGLLVAGSGRRAVCEELSALTTEAGTPSVRVLGTFAILGSRLTLCAPHGAKHAELLEPVRLACERILGAPRGQRTRTVHAAARK
jgi:hypothetical protein